MRKGTGHLRIFALRAVPGADSGKFVKLRLSAELGDGEFFRFGERGVKCRLYVHDFKLVAERLVADIGAFFKGR